MMSNLARARLPVAAVLVVCMMVSQRASATADLGNLLSILESTEDGAWAKVNLNLFSDAWPSVADRSLPGTSYSNPALLIGAWSSFAWDSKRGNLILFGGGHANYAGNEVYTWHASTQLWELASMPSKMVNNGDGLFVPVDGAMNAPTSVHTYDNNEYLPVADRLLVLGGAAFNTGGAQMTQSSDGSYRVTGPYMWDPSKADGTKVGGTTGSANDPNVVGGQMWQNRDIKVTLPSGVNMGTVNGTSAVAVENGADVVYFTATFGAGTNKYLYKYTINDVANPSQDQVALVGPYVGGPEAFGSAGYDPVSGFYVAMTLEAEHPFVVWNTRAAGQSNASQAVSFAGGAGVDPIASPYLAGIDWSPALGAFVVSSGDGSVWTLRTPTSGVMSDVWTFEQVTDGHLLAVGQHPSLSAGTTGVLGKWKYIPNLDAFMALDDTSQGNVWLYRPAGWTNPVPVPEPDVVALMLAGLGMLCWVAHRRRA